MSESVLCQKQSHVARITLNRPERGNAINLENLGALKALLDDAIDDSDLRVIVIEGSSGVFCRGMDFEYLLGEQGHGITTSFSAPYLEVVMTIRNSPKPVIAAIDGEVLAGGMGIALACDIVLATPRSVFGLSEVLFGLIPAYVFPFLLDRLPLKKARFVVLSSRTFTAHESYGLGIVDDLAEEGRLEKKVTKYLKRLLYSSPAALALTKRYSDDISGRQIKEAVQVAGDQLTSLLNDGENIEAIRSFMAGEKMSWMVRYRRPKPDKEAS